MLTGIIVLLCSLSPHYGCRSGRVSQAETCSTPAMCCVQGLDVAVKLLTPDNDHLGDAGAGHDDGGLDVELQIMGRLDHGNVLRVYGASTHDQQRQFLVEELCVCSLAHVMYPRNKGTTTLPLHLVYKVGRRTRGQEGRGGDFSCAQEAAWTCVPCNSA